jgi:hypothetical protein
MSKARVGSAPVAQKQTLEAPGNPTVARIDSVGFELIGIAEMCRAMAESDLHAVPVDCHAIFSSLARLRDLAHRITARSEGTPAELPRQEITIERKAVT